MYMLTWETPVGRGALKCPHALEIPLVFDNVERARDFVGRGDEPQVLADQMSEAWLAFARARATPATPPRFPGLARPRAAARDHDLQPLQKHRR